MRMTRLACVFFVTAMFSTASLFAQPAAPPPADAQAILNGLGFSTTDGQRLLAGEIISNDLEDGSQRELAISVAMLLANPLDQVFEAARQGRTLEVARDVIEFRDLGDAPPTEKTFAGARYSANDAAEILMLARAESGSRFNLATAEVKRFQDIGRRLGTRGAGQDPAVREQVNAAYRSLLMDRCLAYREGGISAIWPYDRGAGERVEPGQELATAAEKLLLAEYTPGFYRAFLNYPRDGSGDIENRFYWIKQQIGDRPGFVLAHRMFQVKPGHALMAERQFYVGHSYNTRQIIVGCLPAQQGTLVFYTNRTSTDRVDVDSVSDILHEVGRRHLRRTVTEHFRAIRQSMPQSVSP